MPCKRYDSTAAAAAAAYRRCVLSVTSVRVSTYHRHFDLPRILLLLSFSPFFWGGMGAGSLYSEDMRELRKT